MVPPTTLPAELSVIAMPFVPLALIVTGLTASVPPASWPTRRKELRAATKPARAFELTTLLVMTSEEVFAATAPFPTLPVMVQLSTTRLLPYDARRPF